MTYFYEKIILAAVLISFLFSVFLWFMKSHEQGVFVGLWVPSILGIGIFFQNIFKRGRYGK